MSSVDKAIQTLAKAVLRAPADMSTEEYKELVDDLKKLMEFKSTRTTDPQRKE